ncbi:MAG: metal-sensitive transcriptional regulator [Defluviitaleaceae bacterium]|nr:metal-sensitive transcriptional regulator [Defluviitaleaceae bacterium]
MDCDRACEECENRNAHQRPAKIDKDLTNRLNRIEGQVKGIKSMIDKGVYCDDVLIQIAAAQSAMYSVSKILLENHMRSCVSRRLQEGDDSVVEEFIKTLGKLL